MHVYVTPFAALPHVPSGTRLSRTCASPVAVRVTAAPGALDFLSPELFHVLCTTSEALSTPVDDSYSSAVSLPSDCWSLGCLLFLMLFGNPPFPLMTLDRIASCPSIYHRVSFPK